MAITPGARAEELAELVNFPDTLIAGLIDAGVFRTNAGAPEPGNPLRVPFIDAGKFSNSILPWMEAWSEQSFGD